jgi:NADH-quinone oxidoreductase subunit G
MGGFKAAAIGPRLDLTFPVEALGDGPKTLAEIAGGAHPFAQKLKDAKAPMVILGMGALARPDGAAIYALARKLGELCQREGWNGFNVLHTAASRVAGLDMGFTPTGKLGDVNAILAAAQAGALDVVYLLGADEIDAGKLGKAFVIYQGHHGDRGAHRADLILPGAAYTEKNGLYVNTEGRVQAARLAAAPPGEAREDWKILRALSDALGKKLPYDTLEALRAALVKAHPGFARLGHVQQVALPAFTAAPQQPGDAPFAYPIANFYMTDPISRASATMAKCGAEFLGGAARTGTHG